MTDEQFKELSGKLDALNAITSITFVARCSSIRRVNSLAKFDALC